jgi:hypothetical protein
VRILYWLQETGAILILGESKMGTGAKIVCNVLPLILTLRGGGDYYNIDATTLSGPPLFHFYQPFSRIVGVLALSVWVVFASGQAWVKAGRPRFRFEGDVRSHNGSFRIKVQNPSAVAGTAIVKCVLIERDDKPILQGSTPCNLSHDCKIDPRDEVWVTVVRFSSDPSVGRLLIMPSDGLDGVDLWEYLDNWNLFLTLELKHAGESKVHDRQVISIAYDKPGHVLKVHTLA